MKDQIYANHALMTAIRVPSNFGGGAQRQGRDIVDRAFTNGYSTVMYAAAVGMLLAAVPVVLWWREPSGEFDPNAASFDADLKSYP
jgi:hypothetical protein